jgi:alpha-galactosidase
MGPAMFPVSPDPSLILISETLRSALLGSPTRIAALALLLDNLAPAIDGVRSPAWILWGSDDAIASPRTSLILQTRLPSARLTILDGAGHDPMASRPAEVERFLLDALAAPAIAVGPKTASWVPVPTDHKGRCDRESGAHFSGDYAEIDIDRCDGVVLRDVRTSALRIRNSFVTVESTRVLGQAVALDVKGSRMVITASDFAGDVAVEVDGGELDLAGVDLRGHRHGRLDDRWGHAAHGLEFLEQLRMQPERVADQGRRRYVRVERNGGGGYQYVNIDDCWMSGRDSSGNLVADASKFPSGIKALADYVHGKGLKLGIYETPSTTTCAGKTGSQGHETQDAKTFASWGVDYLKYDLCSGQRSGFAKMHDALIATGRPIFYSINPVYGGGSCVPPTCDVDELKICNMWRIGSISMRAGDRLPASSTTDKPLAQYAGPGHWNDPDMLEVGRGMSADEDKLALRHVGDLGGAAHHRQRRHHHDRDHESYPDQRRCDRGQSRPAWQARHAGASSGSHQVWSKQMSGTNVRAVALFNRSGSTASMTVKWTDIGLPAGSATVRDLYAQKDLGSSTDSYTATSVPSHGIVMLKIVSGP